MRPEGGRERLNCRLYLWPRQRTTKRNAHDLTGSPRCHDGVWGGKNVKMSSLSHLVWGRGRRDHPPFCPSRKIHTCQISSVMSATLREKRRVEARQVPHFLLYVCKIEFGRDDLKRECQRCQHNISLERIHPSLDTLLVDSKQLLGLAVAKILQGLHSREFQLISV